MDISSSILFCKRTYTSSIYLTIVISCLMSKDEHDICPSCTILVQMYRSKTKRTIDQQLETVYVVKKEFCTTTL